MLPERVKVKLSSEAAESISITPVVVQEIAFRDLVEHLLALSGKDEARIREVLLRGTMVSGASRFRWVGFETEAGALRELLATFPDADPSRAFAAERCVRVVLRGGRQPIEVRREAAERKGLFQRDTFWRLLMDVVSAGSLTYAGYSYRDRADRFVRELSLVEAARLRDGSGAVRYTTLRDQIRSSGFAAVETFVER